MKVQSKHRKVTQNMHGASKNYRYVWDVSTVVGDGTVKIVAATCVFPTRKHTIALTIILASDVARVDGCSLIASRATAPENVLDDPQV